MQTLLKSNKAIVIVILLITSLSLHANYTYAQGLGGMLNKVKKAKDDVKKVKDDVKGQVDEVKKVTGTGESNNGSGGNNSNNGTSGNNSTGSILSNEKYYRITNVATGLVLTLVYDGNQALHKAIYAATIELKPIAIESDAQQWHLYHGGRSATEDEEIIYTKVGYSNGNGYTMWLGRSDSSNNPDDKINNLIMYHNQSTNESLWHFQKLSNGYYRIFNHLAMPNILNVRFEERRDKWNEPRCFQAVTVGGKTKVKQMKNADIDAQYWKLEELDYIPVNR
jgi:hypothetical protein